MIIFGHNIPLVEALFIVLVIIICILITNVIYTILMAKDLKKLKASLVTESANLYKLESDITAFEHSEYPTDTEKKLTVGKYIHTAFQKGFDKAEIQAALTNKGWPKQVIESELNNTVKHLRNFSEKAKEDSEGKDQSSIRRYIHVGFDKGLDKDEIKDSLVKSGWSKQAVDSELSDAVKHLKKMYSPNKANGKK